MTNAPPPEFDDRADPGVDRNHTPGELAHDPDYHKLIAHYQAAEFDACQRLLDHLLAAYPGHPALLSFRDELELKLSVKDLSASIQKGERRERRIAALNLGLFGIIGTLVALAALVVSLFYFINQMAAAEPTEPVPVENPLALQLDVLLNQAEGLLRIGQPDRAVPLVEEAEAINPADPRLPDIITRLEVLLRLEREYQRGLDLDAQGAVEEALAVFQSIQAEQPGLWDVSQRIAAAERTLQVEALLAEGEAAFRAGDWATVINAYEAALALDSSLDDPLFKEQLLKSYLNQVIRLMDNETATVADVELAESYYRKAAVLIPQNRAFAGERGNLPEISANLLEVKFTQIAKANLADRNQTPGSVALAVSYLRKSVSIKPRNTMLQQDLANAEAYQVGLRAFVNQNFTAAITALETLTEVNPNFGNRNAALLLYEAYTAAGREFMAAGLFEEGLGFLRNAEALAAEDPDNPVKGYQARITLGEALAQTGDVQGAVAAYQRALGGVNAAERVGNFPAILTRLGAGNIAAAEGRYGEALETFRDVLDNVEGVLFTQAEIQAGDGAILALVAHANGSTLDRVLAANNLPREMVLRVGRALQVPRIEN